MINHTCEWEIIDILYYSYGDKQIVNMQRTKKYEIYFSLCSGFCLNSVELDGGFPFHEAHECVLDVLTLGSHSSSLKLF